MSNEHGESHVYICEICHAKEKFPAAKEVVPYRNMHKYMGMLCGGRFYKEWRSPLVRVAGERYKAPILDEEGNNTNR